MHATTWSETAPPVDDTEHTVDPELVTDSEDEMKVWGYLMTQYSLKPGRRQGRKGCNGGTNTTTHNGYLDGHGSIENHSRGPHASTLFATLPEREAHQKN